VAAALVFQQLEVPSDREAAERYDVDGRWRYVAGAGN